MLSGEGKWRNVYLGEKHCVLIHSFNKCLLSTYCIRHCSTFWAHSNIYNEQKSSVKEVIFLVDRTINK